MSICGVFLEDRCSHHFFVRGNEAEHFLLDICMRKKNGTKPNEMLKIDFLG